MAEVGIAASTIQFIDVGGRSLIGLSPLCSTLRHVPQTIENSQTTLNHLLAIAKIVKSNHLTLYAGRQAVEFNSMCSDCIKLAKDLESLLNSLTVAVYDGSLRRAWKTVVAAKKEKEILEICERLEQYKTTLSLWLFNAVL